MRKRILVLFPLTESQKELLESAAPQEEFRFTTRLEATREEVQWANIIIGNPLLAQIQNSKNLEWLHLQSAGATEYLDGALPQGTILTNSTGAYGVAISEHMLALLLQIYKKLPLYREAQRKEAWHDFGPVRSVYGSTVLILGLGDIGGEFARRIKALGGYTIGVRRSGRNKPEYLDELYQIDSLDFLLPRADVVAMSLPGTKETYRLMNRERLFQMKQDAVLLNVGRGSTVDTEALCDLLESGRLLGAGLDVTDPEPLPPGHRLWKMPGVFITPHISGGNHLAETMERVVRIGASNLRAYLAGLPLQNLIDFRTGYRKLSNGEEDN